MAKQLKYTYCILFFCLIIISKTFSYTSSKIESWDSTSSSGYTSLSNSVTFEQYLTLKDVNVTFTQDDDNYYFDITANAKRSFSGIIETSDSIMNYKPWPMLYKNENFGDKMTIYESIKKPYMDMKTGSYYTTSNVSINNEYLSIYNYKYHLSGGLNITDANINDNNGEKYFIPNGLRNNRASSNSLFQYASTYPIQCSNNGGGLTLNSNNSSSSFTYKDGFIADYNGNYNIKLTIEKKNIDDYRYLCFAETYVAISNTYHTSKIDNFEGLSICSDTIDLNEFTDCEHEWEYEMIDNENHKAYCDKCKWERTEEHILTYEYDGIKNDVCPCTYIDKVKYTFEINDENTGTKIETCTVGKNYTKHPFTKYTGYNLIGYEKYEKEYANPNNLSTTKNSLRTYFVATVSEFDKVAGNKSVIYKAKYAPITFTFKYANANNYNLNLGGTISPQVIHYNEKAHLKSHIDVRGYVFKGWTFEKGGKKIELNKLQTITNYTTKDLKVFTIYPIYERLDYTIIYNSGDYSFSDGSKEKIIQYNFFDDGNLEEIKIDSSDVVFNGYTDENGKLYTKLSDVQQEIERIGKLGTIIELKVSVSEKKRNNIGNPKPANDRVDESISESTKAKDDSSKDTNDTDESTRMGSDHTETKTKENTETNSSHNTNESTNSGKTNKETKSSRNNSELDSQEPIVIRIIPSSDSDSSSVYGPVPIKIDTGGHSSGGGGGNSGGSASVGNSSGVHSVNNTTSIETIPSISLYDMETTNNLNDNKFFSNGEFESSEYFNSTYNNMILMKKDVKKKIVEEEIVENENDVKDDLDSGKIVATLSVVNKWHKSDMNKLSNIDMLFMFIRSNKVQFIFMMSLLFILLIVYEIIVQKHYRDNYKKETL